MMRHIENERGVALISVLLVTLALVAIAAGALMLTSQTSLVNKFHQRQSLLEAAADAGLEEARSRINDRARCHHRIAAGKDQVQPIHELVDRPLPEHRHPDDQPHDLASR